MTATKAQDSAKVQTSESTVPVGSFGFDDPQADAENNPDHDPVDENIPWKLKWIALLCFVSFPIGQTWTQSSLGPLKNTLRNELGISNTQFGVISSADAIVNSVWPIIGGVLLDWFGPNIIVLLCTGIIFIGSILAASATNLGVWRVLTGGHILMGFGIAVLDTAQQKFFYHWFGISGLAFAFGFENAINKTVSLVAGMTAIPIRNSTGWYGWSFWIPQSMADMSATRTMDLTRPCEAVSSRQRSSSSLQRLASLCHHVRVLSVLDKDLVRDSSSSFALTQTSTRESSTKSLHRVHVSSSL